MEKLMIVKHQKFFENSLAKTFLENFKLTSRKNKDKTSNRTITTAVRIFKFFPGIFVYNFGVNVNLLFK